MLAELLAVVVAVAAVALVYRRPTAGMAVLLGGFLASNAARPTASQFTFHVGPVALYPIDLALLVVFGAYAIRRLLPQQEAGRIPRALLPLVVLLALHVVRGIHDYGLQVGANSSRQWIAFVGAAVYASTMRWDIRLVKVLILGGLAVVGLAVWGIATNGINNANDGVYVNGEFLTLRPLTGSSALLLLQLLIVLAFVPWPWPRLKLPFVVAGSVLVVVVQQRTVLLAAVALAPFLFVRWLHRIHGRSHETGYAAFGVAALTLPAVAWLAFTSSSLRDSAGTVSASQGTLHWRIESWTQLLHKISGTDWIIGVPAGHPMTRFVGGRYTDVQPHDVYVDVLFRFGIVGLIAFVALGVAAYRQVRDTEHPPWPRRTGYAIIVLQAIFGLSYSFNLNDGLWVGLLVGAAFGVAHRAGEVADDRRRVRPMSQPDLLHGLHSGIGP